jgi:hypothetical protein
MEALYGTPASGVEQRDISLLKITMAPQSMKSRGVGGGEDIGGERRWMRLGRRRLD